MRSVTPHGIAAIVQTFGDCTDPRFEAENIVQFALPYPLLYDGRTVLKSRCHRKAVENFQFAFEELAMAGLQDECRNYGGIFNQRRTRGGSKPSTHSWGIAIDLEPLRYPLRSTKRMPEQVVAIWRAAGFAYGGDWRSRPDPMHFQLATGY
jgi:hypothetical protein